MHVSHLPGWLFWFQGSLAETLFANDGNITISDIDPVIQRLPASTYLKE